MRLLFADLLPDSVLTRESKAVFNRAMLTDLARDFVRSWGGGGLNSDYVDVDALRAAWLSDWPPVQSFYLLQQAWLSESHHPRRSAPQGTPGAVAPHGG
jgi:asparagine synthase (glutamine-hydrolysing)